MSVLSLTQQDLEKVADIYDLIRILYKEKDPILDKNLSQDLENHLRQSMTDLTDQLSLDHPNEILEIAVYKSRFSLFEFCAQKISTYLNLQKPGSGKILGQVIKELNNIFEILCEKLHGSLEFNESLQIQLKNQEQETESVLAAAEALENAVNVKDI